MKKESQAIAQKMLLGFVKANAPAVVKGMLSEWLSTTKIDFKMLTMAVKTDMRLWPLLPTNYYPALSNIAKATGDLEWLTPDWLIDVAREAHPPMASLFLGDDVAYAWLKAQVDDCKKELAKLKANS